MSGGGRHASLRYVLVPEARQSRSGDRVAIETEKLSHLRKVLRLDWGSPLRVLDGAGREFEATLEKSGERGAAALGAVVRVQAAEPPLELVIGLPKNATMDWIVEKAVECGATRVRPVVCSRSVVVPSGDAVELEQKYVRRWRRIMDGAVEQSERLWRTEIDGPIEWSALSTIARPPGCVSLAFFSELRELRRAEGEVLAELESRIRSAQGGPIVMFVGPEGGLAGSERADLERLGYHPVSMGETVLRVETAVVASLALTRVIRATGCNVAAPRT